MGENYIKISYYLWVIRWDFVPLESLLFFLDEAWGLRRNRTENRLKG